MKNVYDIKIQEKLNIVLLKNEKIRELPQKEKLEIGVFIHLYYIDTLDYYIKYINTIPSYIDIYISYSDNIVKDKIADMLHGENNYYFIRKENRGRDISSFLVAFRKYLNRYQYICFLHDKKEKTKELKKTTDEWIYSLWENMLASDEYINNIIWKLETNKALGLLVPPGLLEDHYDTATNNLWYDNYENTKQLAKKLNLNCDIDMNKSPITQGTCFWAKTDAIKKLIDYNWNYEDFPNEPLPNDGTINHAVERILAYVAQDAGYVTGWVMTDEYANDYIVNLLDAYASSFQILSDELGIGDLYDIRYRNQILEKLKTFCKNFEKTYIYGAGKRAKQIYRLFEKLNIVPEGFVVSQKAENQQVFFGIEIIQFNELNIESEVGFVIGVRPKFKNEIIEILHKHNVEDSKILVLE